MAFPLWRVACRDLPANALQLDGVGGQSRAKFPPNDYSWDLLDRRYRSRKTHSEACPRLFATIVNQT